MSPSSPKRRWLRGLLFRAGAVLLGLAPFVLFEVFCVALDWGRPDYQTDPFVGFSKVRPLFVLNQDKTRYETAPSRSSCFRPDSFAAQKPAGEFRIFCLGGSTVQGRPFAIETSFTTYLEIALQAAQPNRRWQVVNCGGISYASYRLAPILEEVLQYQPDLIILYTGHNEFLEDRTYRYLKNRSAVRRKLEESAASLRMINLARQGLDRLRGAETSQPSRPILQQEVDALLDYRGGLEAYTYDPAWRQGVIDHFEFNLRRMAEICRRHGTRLWLANPAVNLRDCPPFKSAHDSDLSADEQRRFDQLWRRARESYRENLRQAVRLLEHARRIDPVHAGLHYELAKCYDSLGRKQQALDAYVQAKDRDICPLRILEPMREAIFRVTEDFDLPLVNVRKHIKSQSRDGVPGGYQLVDHVHPTISVHQQIGSLFAEELARQGDVRLPDDWAPRRDQLYREHFDKLDNSYFAEGQQRLENLRLWAAGKGPKQGAVPLRTAPSPNASNQP